MDDSIQHLEQEQPVHERAIETQDFLSKIKDFVHKIDTKRRYIILVVVVLIIMQFFTLPFVSFQFLSFSLLLALYLLKLKPSEMKIFKNIMQK